MSSYKATPLNVYLISFFTLAAIAALVVVVFAATEVVRHYRRRATRHESPSTYAAHPIPS
jgi:heme/copper-type cytochrome/quinol oxidase subunit 2